MQLEASTVGGVNLNYFIVKLTCICLKINNFLEKTYVKNIFYPINLFEKNVLLMK